MFNRRDFLKTGSMIALGSSVPGFLSRTAAQTAGADQPGSRETILVVVQLTGGNDGLNTVIPYGDENYARYRPTLRQPRNRILTINNNDQIGLHPSMRGMADLLQDRKMCIVQGVGYPNPSQSHFRSMDIWQGANTADNLTEGWVGRALRSVPGASSFHLARDNEPAPLALTGAPRRVPSITSLQDFQLQLDARSGADRTRQQRVIETAARGANENQPSLLDFVRRTAVNTYESSRRLQEIGQNYQPRVPYPQSQLANHLRLAAQLIDGGLGARLFYVTLDGFDTHAGQANNHANLLTQLSEAISAFYRDLAARGHGDRLLIMTFSEFGRRARENGSRGTDHGAAAPMMLVGGRVQPGLVGAHPSLTQLDRGNLRHHTDFRQVYAAVLDNWLGVNSRQVLGRQYEGVGVSRG